MSGTPNPPAVAPESAREAAWRNAGRIVMQVLWPAFLLAIIAEGIFFSIIDPRELVVVAESLRDSRVAAYTIAFFVFWALFACSSAITWFLSHGVGEAPQRPGD